MSYTIHRFFTQSTKMDLLNFLHIIHLPLIFLFLAYLLSFFQEF